MSSFKKKDAYFYSSLYSFIFLEARFWFLRIQMPYCDFPNCKFKRSSNETDENTRYRSIHHVPLQYRNMMAKLVPRKDIPFWKLIDLSQFNSYTKQEMLQEVCSEINLPKKKSSPKPREQFNCEFNSYSLLSKVSYMFDVLNETNFIKSSINIFNKSCIV